MAQIVKFVTQLIIDSASSDRNTLAVKGAHYWVAQSGKVNTEVAIHHENKSV